MKPIIRPALAGLGLVVAASQPASAEETTAPSRAEVDELRQQVAELTKTVSELKQQLSAKPAETPAIPASPEPEPLPPAPTPAVDAKASMEPVKAPDFAADLSTDPLPEPKKTDSSIFNPEISAAIDFVGSYSHAADNFNFTPRNIEVMIQSNVDQLAHAYIVFNAESELDPWTKTDPFEDVSLGVEEAAIETTSLPYGLALKGGEFFADFSRLGKVHSHELPFTDRPSSLEGILGGETKSRGIELSWIPAIDHYVRLTAGAVDDIGAETPVTGALTSIDGEEADLFAGSDHRSFGDLMFYARAATIFELNERTSLNIGANYAHGGDTGTRELLSGDFKFTWLPDAASHNEFTLGGEVLHGKTSGAFGADASFAGGPTRGSSTADGAYLFAQYRIGKTWEPGIRYDWFRPEAWTQTDGNGDDIADGIARSRSIQNSWSAYLTYHFSEFNRFRAGLSFLEGFDNGYAGQDSDWLGFLQWSVIIGSHQHSFQP